MKNNFLKICALVFLSSCQHAVIETTGNPIQRSTSSEATPHRDIIGYIDSVSEKVVGWTCLKGKSQSIDFKISIGGPLKQGTELGPFTASEKNEPDVNSACLTTGSSHRFSIQLPNEILKKYAGQPVYVYGINPNDDSFGWLNSNGKFVVPNATPKPTRPIDFSKQQLIGDIGYTNGFKVIDTDGSELYVNRLPGQNLSTPTWEIAQWSTLETIPNIPQQDPKYYTWSNRYKSLKIGVSNETKTEAIFGIDSNAEYSGIYRKSSDKRGWPHLLISQTIATPDNLNNYRPLSFAKRIILDLDIQVLHADNIKKYGYDSGVHTSQFVLYFTLQNLNPNTKSYKKYIWFGVPLYDARYSFVPKGAFIDKGTQSLIWAPDGKEILSTSLQDLNPHQIHKDLLPYMKNAIKYAYEEGIVDTKNLNDYYIGHMNTGFEVPGLAQVVVKIKNLSLIQENN